MKYMKEILIVFFGSGFGGIVRYLISMFFTKQNHNFPLATFLINIIGCFIIGLVVALFSKNLINEPSKLLLATGICGGFTTFSAFAVEGIALIQRQQFGIACMLLGHATYIQLLQLVYCSLNTSINYCFCHWA
jgi:CrcB protein